MLNNLFNRYIWLVDTIYTFGPITFDEINRRWALSRYNEEHIDIPQRTFHRDRIAIENLFDINIECNKPTNTYYIAQKEDVKQDGLRRWMLSSFAVKQMIDESALLRDQIVYEEIPSGQQELSLFVSAMRDHLRVRITHKNYKDDSGYTTLISPYCLKVFKQRWYVAGLTDRYPDEIRVYALDRLSNVQLSEAHYELPTGFTAHEFFQYSYGVYHSDTFEDITIRVAHRAVPFIDSVPLHASQQKIEENADYSVYRYKLAPMLDFKQQLRTLGPDVEVLTPASFRQEFIDDTRELMSRYRLD